MPKIGSTIMQTLTAQILLAVLVLSAPIFVQADNISVTFVVAKNDGIYKKIITSTEQSLNNAGHDIDKTIIEVNNTQTVLPTNELSDPDNRIISIGTKAAAFSYQQYPDKTVTNALITYSSFQKLALDNFGGTEQALDHHVTPLFIDQPISRFFALGLQLVPNSKTIGILVGPSNKLQIPNIKAKAESMGLSVRIALLEPDSNPIKVIEPIMRSSDFFVVLPDRKHINQLAARWTLPLSYRYKKPLIAYSQKYVDAGALASVFTSPDNVAATIARQLKSDKKTPITYQLNSAPFSISLNHSVARSLRIKVQPIDHYQEQLRAKEVTP